MTIAFMCPNGHQLSAPVERAGKQGKCPKCSVAFVVPDPAEPPDQGAADDEADADPNIIVFLCPNGHKLNGPSSLKGKPGQCPHCGSKFVIPEDDPTDDDPTHEADADEAEDAAADEIVAEGVVVEEELPVGQVVADDTPIALGAEDIVEVAPSAPVGVVESEPTAVEVPTVRIQIGNPYADFIDDVLVAAGDAADYTIRLTLKSGGEVEFAKFMPEKSDQTYGVFMSSSSPCKVACYAWEAIAGVEVEGLKEPPFQ